MEESLLCGRGCKAVLLSFAEKIICYRSHNCKSPTSKHTRHVAGEEGTGIVLCFMSPLYLTLFVLQPTFECVFEWILFICEDRSDSYELFVGPLLLLP